MKVAGIQADLAWEDPAANFARFGPLVERAAKAGAKLVALPEMFATGFSMATDRVAEPDGGPAAAFLAEQAVSRDVVVVGSVATNGRAARPQNLGLAAFPDGSVGHYAKIHPFTFGGEAERYAPGDDTLTFTHGGVRVSLVICYDLRFPELFAALADRTDLFVVIANWPSARRDHWETLLKARAIDSQAYVLGVNRVGSGGGLVYPGGSVLHGPAGEVVATAPKEAEALVLGDVDAEHVREVRRAFPVLPDRRPDVYRRAGEKR